MVSPVVLSVILMWHGALAQSLYDMQQEASSSAEDVISNIALNPKVRTLNPSLENPFSNIEKQDLSSFLSHIHPVREHTDGMSEKVKDMKPNLNHKHKISKSQFLKQDVRSTCSKYMNKLEDTALTDTGIVELIKYLCEYLAAGLDTSKTDAVDGKYIIETLMSLDEAKSPVHSQTSRPPAVRPDPIPTSYRPINGRRDWMVLNEEYPGMMKQYINQFGNTTFLI